MMPFPEPPPSWLRQRDSRVKLLASLAYILVVLLTPPAAYRTWLMLAGLLTLLTAFARVPIRAVAPRLAVVMPFIALSALGVALGGSWEMFWQVTIKTVLCVGAAAWLSLTTPFHELLIALRWLRVPTLFTVLSAFSYRYWFVLVEEAVRMSRAYLSRCPRPQTLRDAVTVGKLTGTLMLRAYSRAERVYLAMLSRGFDGEFRTLTPSSLTGVDIAFLCGIIVGLAIAVLLAFNPTAV